MILTVLQVEKKGKWSFFSFFKDYFIFFLVPWMILIVLWIGYYYLFIYVFVAWIRFINDDADSSSFDESTKPSKIVKEQSSSLKKFNLNISVPDNDVKVFLDFTNYHLFFFSAFKSLH
jgi:hypothetical protein